MARRSLILRLSAFAAAGTLAAAPAAAQNKQKKELARIQSELRRTLAELETLRASEASLGKDLDRLPGLDVVSRRRVESLQDGIRSAEGRKAELKSRLESASRVDGFWTAALSAETARHAATVQRGMVQFVVGGGMLTGGIFGAACSLFFTIMFNTRAHQAKNKVFVNGMRAWLNARGACLGGALGSR